MSDWASISQESLPAGENEVTITPDTHTGRQERGAAVVFAAASGLVERRVVKQEGKTAFVEVSNIPASGVFDVPSGGGSVMIEGESNAAELVLDNSYDPLPVTTAALQAAETIYPLSGMAEAVVLTGDPGAAAQYAFRYGLAFGEHLGRSDRTWYGRVEGNAPELSYPKGSAYFRITQEGGEEFVSYDNMVVVQISVPASGVSSRTYTGEGNLRSLSFRRGDSSPWPRALPMEAVLTVTGKDSGEESTVQVTEADTLYSIPNDPGAAEAYAWKLVVSRFPENTGRVTKKGFWNVGDSRVNVAVVMINQLSGGEFCDVETNIPSMYTFPKATQGTLSIKGTSNCTNVWLRGLTTADLQNASMYINSSKANEWEGNNTEPGNIYEFRGEDEAYEWEIRVIFPATTGIEKIRTYTLGWTKEDGSASSVLKTFSIVRS